MLDGSEWFWVGSLHMNIQLMLEFFKDPFLVLHFFHYTLNDIPDDVNCDIAIYADDTNLCPKCDQASDLWQQLELASALESDQRDTVDWGKKWFVDFSAGKTQLVLLDRSNNTRSIDVKMNGFVLEKKILAFLKLEFLLKKMPKKN